MMDVHCENSPDGRHEIVFVYEPTASDVFVGSHEALAMCRRCKRHWFLEEVAPLISAAMRLTAEEAERLSTYVGIGPAAFERLGVYAAKWRGG